jgi:ABC-type phosphate/phosphonate transport system permease subunit
MNIVTIYIYIYIYQFLGLNSFSVYRSSFVSCLNTNMGKLLFSHIVCHHGNYIRKMLETIEIYH